uniref:Uncharacterized protein n=1 Tax=Strigamia maritima TaxID=126957 RepID=T1JHX6_STRMM
MLAAFLKSLREANRVIPEETQEDIEREKKSETIIKPTKKENINPEKEPETVKPKRKKQNHPEDMSSGLKIDIQWSPCIPNRFITFGTDLTLYRVEKIVEGDVNPLTVKLSDTHCAQIMFTNAVPQYLKCVAWYPTPEYEYLLALGLANGKIVLTNLRNSQEPSNLVGREFVPRHPRQCNCVSWNPEERNLLAAALERAKTDHSILIWDVTRNNIKHESERRLLSGSTSNDVNSSGSTKPFIEMGNSESVHSFHWFWHQPKSFVTGMSNRHLKVFDIREATKVQQLTSTRAVNGITVDNFNENRLASFSEVFLVKSSFGTCETLKNRSNLLASVARESCILKLYDIQHTSSTDEVELTSFERHLMPSGQQLVTSFSWHPTEQKRLILVSPMGAIADFRVFERIAVTWSPSSRLTWNDDSKHLREIENQSYYETLNDISVKMKLRALRDYGLEGTEPNNSLIYVPLVKTMQGDGVFSSWTRPFKFEGVKDIICSNVIGQVNTASTMVDQEWPNVSTQSPVTTRIYCSKDREYALQLCGWGCDRNGLQLSKFLDNLEKDKYFARAAAIAIFNLQIQRAIELLRKGAQQEDVNTASSDPGVNLNVVAMALSGFTVEKSALWRRMCSSLRHQLYDPYLRAIFSFLTCEQESFDEILTDDGIALSDKVAFACWFLTDSSLSDYLYKLTIKLISRGNVEGILLTGLIGDGLELMQRYVDNTGDIQTLCLIIMHANPTKILDDPRVLNWIASYRSLLDQLQLWHNRAKFDVQWNKISKVASRPLQHIYISCNYCGKSISSSMGSQSALVMSKGHHPAMFANKTKMTSCPGCRKPLPRCAVCLINMGTPSGTGIVKHDGKNESSNLRLTKFASWFTWCQTCRHGGHTAHIIEWFKEQAECPVTGCTCKCMCLDSADS